MATRPKGTFDFSANFETLIESTLDARQIVDDFSNLLDFTAADYIPLGFPVAVKGLTTPSERGIYQCIDNTNLSSPASWNKIGALELSGTAKRFAMFSGDGKSVVNSNFREINSTQWAFGDAFKLNIRTPNLTADRTWVIPDKTGTPAMLSDIVPSAPSTGGGYAVYEENTSYLVASDPILYYINADTGDVEYYEVNNDFTSANPLDIDADILAGHITKIQVAGTKVSRYDFDSLYFEDAVVYEYQSGIAYLFRAKENIYQLYPFVSSKWEMIGIRIDDTATSSSKVFSSSWTQSLINARQARLTYKSTVDSGATYNLSVVDENKIIRRSHTAANTSYLSLAVLSSLEVDSVIAITQTGAGRHQLTLESGISVIGFDVSTQTFKHELKGDTIMIKKYSNTSIGFYGNRLYD